MNTARAAKRQVLAANDAFYKAMREGDYAAMDRLWAERRTVTCTHPDWHMLVGREAVMESWRVILTEHEPPEIWPIEAQAIVTGSTAMVLCTEQIGGIELVASNGFVREGLRWRVLNHQSAHAPAESTQ
jgi:ketosteroid isomerase-like protein